MARWEIPELNGAYSWEIIELNAGFSSKQCLIFKKGTGTKTDFIPVITGHNKLTYCNLT